MKRLGRRNLIGVWIGGTVIAFGCADDAAMPAQPSSVPSPVAQGASSSPAPLSPVAAMGRRPGGDTPDLAGHDMGGELKLKLESGPQPVGPTGEIEDLQPTLEASRATAAHPPSDFDGRFEYEFELFAGDESIDSRVGIVPDNGSDSPRYQVQQWLKFERSNYRWRVRAVLDDPAEPGNRGYGDWLHATFTTPPVKFSLDENPRDGRTSGGVRPHFDVNNPAVANYRKHTPAAEDLWIEIQVAPSSKFEDTRTTRAPTQRRGWTRLELPTDLMADSEYFWRMRAVIRGQGPLAGAESPWSKTWSFTTPSAPGTGRTDPVPGGPAAPFGSRDLRNMVHVVEAVARQHPGKLSNSCQSHGGSWDFMDLVVEALRAENGRWGFNCKRGNCNDISHDVVAFYHGPETTSEQAQGKTDVYIIDVILGHCGSNPRPAWIDQTQATADAGAIGRWKYPR